MTFHGGPQFRSIRQQCCVPSGTPTMWSIFLRRPAETSLEHFSCHVASTFRWLYGHSYVSIALECLVRLACIHELVEIITGISVSRFPFARKPCLPGTP